MKKTSSFVASFRHNGTNVCSGVFTFPYTVTTTLECAKRLIAFLSVEEKSITIISDETGRIVKKVTLLSLPNHGQVDIAFIKVDY